MKFLLPVLAMAFIPFVSSAATYFYVNTSGVVASIEATSADAALRNAPNIAHDSGVALDMGFIEEGDRVKTQTTTQTTTNTSGTFTYQYVDTAGHMRSIEAHNATEAMLNAPNIAHDSGVVLSENTTIPSSVEVNL